MVAPSLWPDVAAEVRAGRAGKTGRWVPGSSPAYYQPAKVAKRSQPKRRPQQSRPACASKPLFAGAEVLCPWCREYGPAFAVAGGEWGKRCDCTHCGRPLQRLTDAKLAAIERDTGRPFAENFALVLKLIGGKFAPFADLVGVDEAASRGRLYFNEAAARWEPGGGSKFSTFATTWVSGRLKRDWTAERERNPLAGAAAVGGGDDGVPVAAAGPDPEADRWQRCLYLWAEVVLTPAQFAALLANGRGAAAARKKLLSDVRTAGILEQMRAA